MRASTLAPLALTVGTLLGCNKEEAAPAPSRPVASATVASPATTTTATDAGAHDTAPTIAAPAPAKPAPAVDKTFTHSKLGFTFSYPDTLTPKEDAKGVTLSSATLAKVTVDRSDNSKGPEDVSLGVRLTLEDGALVAVAKKTNPHFGNSFPNGTTASFKEDKEYAEKVTVGSSTAYRFTMGSHGSNEQDTFVPAKGNKTLVVRCSYIGDGHNPKMSEERQLEACAKIVSTLKF